ncbi:MAG: SipW-dependent-type signal peptide-containing protein, partial [Candidatus Shapirobacteria bacterium]|nr:SipW-dependent-type signal peptide-containing protein [Candidatus Shapirobacteria bacterium]
MIKRIFLKSLIFLILVCLFKTHSTNAYFTNAAVSSENTFTVGDWTAPNSHVVNPLDDPENPGILSDYENNSIFNVYYIAEDSLSGIGQVQFYYSYNYGNWQLFGVDTDIDGEFQFTSPDGDGVYEFKTVAFDNVGNEEDEDENDVGDSQDLTTVPVFLYTDASTIVDTIPPVTMFSVNPYLAVTNELLYNGGFESGNLDGWTVVESDGDHKVVGN